MVQFDDLVAIMVAEQVERDELTTPAELAAWGQLIGG